MTRTADLIQRLASVSQDAVDAACFDEFDEATLDRVEDFVEWLSDTVAAHQGAL